MAAGLLQKRPQLVGRLVGHGDVQPLLVEPKWDGQVLARHVLGHQGEGLRFRVVTAEVHDRHAEDLAQHPSELTLAEHAHVDEDLAQPLTRVLLCDAGLARPVSRWPTRSEEGARR